MTNMILWKTRRIIRTVPFYVLAAICLTVAVCYLPVSFGDGLESAGQLLFETCSRVASVLVLVAGLYAAICVTRDIQGRFLSVAIMSGNSVFSVVFTELLAYFSAIFLCVFIPSILLFGIGSFVLGGSAGGIEVVHLLILAFVYAFVSASAFSIVFPLCFVVRSEGMSCIVNLILLLVCWSGTEAVIQAVGAEVSVPGKFFPFVQLFMLCGADPGSKGFSFQMMTAFSGAIFFIVILFLITYQIFNKMEKK